MNKHEVLTDGECADLEAKLPNPISPKQIIRHVEHHVLAKLTADVEFPPLPSHPYYPMVVWSDREKQTIREAQRQAVASDRARLAGQEAVAEIEVKPNPIFGPSAIVLDHRLLSAGVHKLYAAPVPAQEERGEIVITKHESGQIIAVTRQDEEGRILEVIAESAQAEKVETLWVMEKDLIKLKAVAETLQRAGEKIVSVYTTPPTAPQSLLDAAESLLDAYSYYFPKGNPWGDKLRAALQEHGRAK